MFVIIMAEVWKTTPFIALLLLGGLALVPEDLYKAAEDGRGDRRGSASCKITLPLIKPALMVAVLFRTLDAFRIYDAAFIITRGANDTETVSILGYDQLVNRLNLGLGSAVSILIFICVMIIAFIFFRFLGASPETEVSGHDRIHRATRRSCGRSAPWSSCSTRSIPVAWIVSLSLKDPTTIGDQKFFPTEVDDGQLQRRVRRAAWASTARCSTRSASR